MDNNKNKTNGPIDQAQKDVKSLVVAMSQTQSALSQASASLQTVARCGVEHADQFLGWACQLKKIAKDIDVIRRALAGVAMTLIVESQRAEGLSEDEMLLAPWPDR